MYGPGGSVSSSKRPVRSLTANALVAPRADTSAPATGLPRSSRTLPRIAPCDTDAMCVIGRGGATLCALAAGARQRSTRTPTAADEHAMLLMVCSGRPLALGLQPRALRRADRKVHVPRQCLVRDLVGDLDFEPVRAFGERG